MLPATTRVIRQPGVPPDVKPRGEHTWLPTIVETGSTGCVSKHGGRPQNLAGLPILVFLKVT